ncbi:unnamed protein product [Rotaria sordida]|uniref:Uncharacterized protein n=2 Tax=Rotaria sordida TaxID=392033 RepID=A0A814V4T1_9BILA|nr:unnamed protein product [Rotaria sordida]
MQRPPRRFVPIRLSSYDQEYPHQEIENGDRYQTSKSERSNCCSKQCLIGLCVGLAIGVALVIIIAVPVGVVGFTRKSTSSLAGSTFGEQLVLLSSAFPDSLTYTLGYDFYGTSIAMCKLTSFLYFAGGVMALTLHHGDLIVLWFGEKNSSLRTALMEYLITEDITLILFSTEEQLWCWLNTYSSLKVASLVIQTNINIQNIVCRSSTFANIHSILIRCSTNELITLQRFSRSYFKIDGIFADDKRLLIKLVIDLALFSEEIGDQQREDENNELNAQRNYGRARNLCALAKRL